MKKIEVSVDVFAEIWSRREVGEETENDILARLLLQRDTRLECSDGLRDKRFGVFFPNGFEIYRTYLGTKYSATVVDGYWKIKGFAGEFSSLNELSRAIGTKTENAWMNWFYETEDGERAPAKALRKSDKVSPKAGGGSKSYDKRWCDDVKDALLELGGVAHLEQIYKRVREIRQRGRRSTPKSLREVVRKELEIRSPDSEAYLGQDWFRLAGSKGEGYWRLSSQQPPKS